MTRLIASVLIVLSVAACKPASDYREHRQDAEACARQPDLAWCSE